MPAAEFAKTVVKDVLGERAARSEEGAIASALWFMSYFVPVSLMVRDTYLVWTEILFLTKKKYEEKHCARQIALNVDLPRISSIDN